jgi:hypothetical protein
MPLPASLLRLAGLFLLSATAGLPAAPAPADSVEQWGVFELSLPGPQTGNPFLDVDFSARFTHGASPIDVPGFYDGNGTYRIRFMPDQIGAWHYETRSNAPALAGHTGNFSVGPPSPGDHGPVRVAATYHFAYADGSPYFPFGTTCYNLTQLSNAREDQTLHTLAASPFNKVRLLILPTEWDPAKGLPLYFPFPGNPPKDWDYSRFNPEFFQHLEKRVGQLRDLGIEADLILFSPYDHGKLGFDRMSPVVDDRYVRYVVARLSAYRNVWWSLANEYDLMHEKTESDWDRLFQVVQSSDPSQHLRSIHHSILIYDNSHPWVTHASIQNGSAVEDAGRAMLYRDVWRKPVIFDEVKYEGNIDKRWGQLTAQEMVQRFWEGTIAGTYVTHGEVLVANGSNDTWTYTGGVLRGQSPPRIAFLRSIVEAGPASGLDPIDKWQDTRLAGQPGQYYLLYFGADQPSSWPFVLPREGLSDGAAFQVDLLDTWNMTVTPLPGTFTVKKLDAYTFADDQGRAVSLPGQPWLALRIRRVSP